MLRNSASTIDGAVGVLAPTGRDADVTVAVLGEAGIQGKLTQDMNDACALIKDGSSALIIAEEALSTTTLSQLERTVAAQPHWSDYPIVILASPGRGSEQSRSLLADLGAFTNATVLERPLRKTTLISTMRVALRSRRRQLELRDRLEEAEKMSRERDLMLQQQRRIAETLQFSILEAPPSNAFPNIEIGTEYVPAGNEAMVGGDFFDAFSVDGRVALVVGDVVGKGLTAATQMAEIKFALRAIVRQNPNPARALAQLNNYVISAEQAQWKEEQTLVAVLLAMIDSTTGSVSVAVAGAEPPIFVREGLPAELVHVTGLPIGAAARSTYQSTGFQLNAGDMLMLATDGLAEARRGPDFFGTEGLVIALDSARSMPTSSDVASAVIAKVREFAIEGFRDDVCVLVARWLGNAEASLDDAEWPMRDRRSPKSSGTAARLSRISDLDQQLIGRISGKSKQSIDPDTILWEALNSLAQHLGVSSAFYGEVDTDAGLLTVYQDYCRDTTSISGVYPISQFSDEVFGELLAGSTASVSDTMLDARTAAKYEGYANLEIRSLLAAPMLKDGRLVGILSLQDPSPRQWTGNEISLISEVANVTRLVWDNSYLNRRSRSNVQQQRTFLRDVLMSVTEGHLRLCDETSDLPDVLEPFGGPLEVGKSGGLASVRSRTANACNAAGLNNDRRYDLETAVSEAAMNAITHGGGGTVNIFYDPAGVVQVRIVDHGSGISDENLPRAALSRGYSTTDTLGHGMKMMLQTADRVFLLTGNSGTTVVLEQTRNPIHHLW